MSDEQTGQPLTGKARSLANLRPFAKGNKANLNGRPKGLTRFGDILMKQLEKSVTANLAGGDGQQAAGLRQVPRHV